MNLVTWSKLKILLKNGAVLKLLQMLPYVLFGWVNFTFCQRFVFSLDLLMIDNFLNVVFLLVYLNIVIIKTFFGKNRGNPMTLSTS